MGQAMRIMTYDRAANERNAVSALVFVRSSVTTASSEERVALKWHRLDDGVMGGQSETTPFAAGTEGERADDKNHRDGILRFTGTINTNGGGFASLRPRIPEGTLSSSPCNQADDDDNDGNDNDNDNKNKNVMTGLKIRFRGDGKTYKFLLSDGSGGGPWAKSPSWQFDIPTQSLLVSTSSQENDTCSSTITGEKNEDDGIGNSSSSKSGNVTWQEAILPFDSFLPNMGPGRGVAAQQQQHVLDPAKMQQMGIMLSLLKANNEPNPKETFGQGFFPFALHVESIQPVYSNDE